MRKLTLSRRTFLQCAAGGAALVALPACRTGQAFPPPAFSLWVDDATGCLGQSRAPVAVALALDERQQAAVAAGRLRLREEGSPASAPGLPAQFVPPDRPGQPGRLCWLMPPGPPGRRCFTLVSGPPATLPDMAVRAETITGRFTLQEGDSARLCYRYATVGPGDRLASIAPGNRKYAIPRSNYIHPLYGPHGEELTLDWPLDHPHHRGIYWAWPEVDWQGRRGDLHALQNVFARPTGRCQVTGGPVFAQVDAENLWLWEDREPIVRERALLRAYRSTSLGWLLDLEFEFAALNDQVALARRDTTHYGGLNLRFNSLRQQEIVKYVDPTAAAPRPAWGALSGIFAGVSQASRVVILPSAANPDYPPDWVDYPNLNWLQPTFPASGTRHLLRPGHPLILRYRLWIHAAVGPLSQPDVQWLALNSEFSPRLMGAKQPPATR